MWKKAFLSIFFALFLAGTMAWPAAALAGSYEIYNADGTTKLADANYSGIVPCGKCVKVVPSLTTDQMDQVLEQIKATTERKCYQPSGGSYNQLYLNCQLCHFFVMLEDVVDFLLIKVIPPLAVLMIVIGGVMFYLGGAKPDMISRGRKLMVGVLIGLFLIYGSYIIVGVLLKLVGAAEIESINKIFENGIFSVECKIVISKAVSP